MFTSSLTGRLDTIPFWILYMFVLCTFTCIHTNVFVCIQTIVFVCIQTNVFVCIQTLNLLPDKQQKWLSARVTWS